jgi:N6-adenosine-specific RNA methylase IME4
MAEERLAVLDKKKQLPVLSLPGRITATALDLPESMSFEEWQEVGQRLQTAERSLMWWMGDWWNYGSHRYGERASQALGSEFAFQTWMDAGWVASKIETSRRREVLPWSVHREVAALPPEKQEEVLFAAEAEAWTVRDTRRAVRRLKAGSRFEVPPPSGKYRVIYADPPWEYGNEQPEYHTEQADHYPLMPMQEIRDLPIREMALDDAVLFLWVTSPILRESFDVVADWGFEYKSSFIWDKIKHNMGHYNSVRHEILLICVRGSCPPDEQKLFDSVQSIERTEHSRKPEEFRKIIDTIYPFGPRIELFNRGGAPEPWRVWGNE